MIAIETDDQAAEVRAHDRPPRRWFAGDAIKVAAVAAGLQGVAWAILAAVFGILRVGYDFFTLTDISAPYFPWVESMARGLLPYRDFPVEYPPLALLPIAAVGHADDFWAYAHAFAWLMFWTSMLCAMVIALAAYGSERRATKGYVAGAYFALSVLAIGALVGNRYDIVVALVLAVAALLLERRRWEWAAFALGVGFALKIVPVILLPLVLILAPGIRRKLKSLGAFLVSGVSPFLWVVAVSGIDGVTYMVRYHLLRPLEIESVTASPFLFAATFGGVPAQIGTAFGSQTLVMTGTDLASSVATVGLVLAVGWMYWLAHVRRDSLRANPRRIVFAALAVVFASLVFSKVLSPQYFIWAMPLIALATAERPTSGVLPLLMLLLTHLLFPANYPALTRFESFPVLVLVARNILLLVAFVLSARYLLRVPTDGPPAAAERELGVGGTAV